VPYVVASSPFFNAEVYRWLTEKGYKVRTVAKIADEYKHARSVYDHEYVNTALKLKIGFIGNLVSICGWQDSWNGIEASDWIEVWHFTNPMKIEAIQAIIRTYRTSI